MCTWLLSSRSAAERACALACNAHAYKYFVHHHACTEEVCSTPRTIEVVYGPPRTIRCMRLHRHVHSRMLTSIDLCLCMHCVILCMRLFCGGSMGLAVAAKQDKQWLCHPIFAQPSAPVWVHPSETLGLDVRAWVHSIVSCLARSFCQSIGLLNPSMYGYS